MFFMKIVQLNVKVKNPMGLHARPASTLTKVLQGCSSKVTINYRNKTADARSIISILMLAINKNSELLLTIEGEDADETAKKLSQAFENQFGELDRQA